MTTLEKIFNYKTPEAVRNLRCAELGALVIDPGKQGQGIATKALTEILGKIMINMEGRDPITKADVIITEVTPGSNGPVCSALSNNPEWHSIVVAGGMGSAKVRVPRAIIVSSHNKALIDEMKANKQHGKEWISLEEHMEDMERAASLSSKTKPARETRKAIKAGLTHEFHQVSSRSKKKSASKHSPRKGGKSRRHPGHKHH